MKKEALEQFKIRLAQTIFWSAPRADIRNPATSLRTPELRPGLLEANRVSAVNSVAHSRELLGGGENRKATIPRRLGTSVELANALRAENLLESD